MLRTRNRLKSGGDSWYKSPVYLLNNVAPTLIHDYAAQRYYNSTTGVQGFPVTTLRSTNAMQFDAQGRLVWAPVQINRRGNDFPNWDVWSSDGNSALNGDAAPTGMPAYRATWTSALPVSGVSITSLPVIVGQSHCFSVYLKYVNHQWARVAIYSSSAPTNQCRLWVDLVNKVIGTSSATGGTLSLATVEDIGNGWVRATIAGDCLWSSATDLAVLVATAAGDASATRVGAGASIDISSSIIEPFGPQSPQQWRSEFNTFGSQWYGSRFTFDPNTLAARGLWVEPQCSNLHIKSETNVTGDWNNASFCTASNAGTIWNRFISRITVTSTGSSQFNYITTATLTPSASTVYTMSVFLKKGNISRIQITPSANYTDAYCNYNFDTNTITLGGTGAVAGSGLAEILQGGWVRVQFAFTSIAVPVGGASFIIAFIDADGAARLAGTATNGAYVDLFGMQVETDGVASSYIPTYGTSLTRGSDNFSITPVPFIDQTKGTLFVKAVCNKADANLRRLVDLSDNSANNRIQIARNSAGSLTAVSSVGGVAEFSPSTANNVGTFALVKAAVRYSSAGKAIVLNGGTVGSTATSPPTSGYTHLFLGHIQGFTKGNASYGFIQEFRYYPDVSASDAQLQALTA